MQKDEKIILKLIINLFYNLTSLPAVKASLGNISNLISGTVISVFLVSN